MHTQVFIFKPYFAFKKSMGHFFKGFTASRYFYHYLFWIIILLSYFVDTALLLHFNASLFFMNFFLKNGLLIAIVYLNLRVLMPAYLEKKRYLAYYTWILTLLIIGTLAINVLEFNSWEAFYQRFFEKTPMPNHDFPLHEKEAPQAVIVEEKEVNISMNLTEPRKFILDFLTVCRYLVISVLLKFIDDFFSQREVLNKIQIEKKTAELNYLKAQVNPHFLFNTLNNLYGLIIERSEQAAEMVLKLSDMMKYMLSDGHADKVLLKNDVENLKNYIEIERIRLPEYTQKKVVFTVEGDINSQIITPLLLLPLLENGFKHGVHRSIDKAFLTVTMLVKNNQLDFKMVNNKPTAFSFEETVPSFGIGIENVKKRLEVFYHSNYTLEFSETNTDFSIHLTLNLI